METLLGAPIRGRIRLQEIAVRIQLNRQQIRYVKDPTALAEILTNAFFLSERVSHQSSSALKTFHNLPATIPAWGAISGKRPVALGHQPFTRSCPAIPGWLSAHPVRVVRRGLTAMGIQ
jgi:hypothetical protein